MSALCHVWTAPNGKNFLSCCGPTYSGARRFVTCPSGLKSVSVVADWTTHSEFDLDQNEIIDLSLFIHDRHQSND